MEPKPPKTKYDAELISLSALFNGLERIGKKVRGRDARIIAAALEALREHIKTTEDLRTLGHKLIEIENEHESESKQFPDQIGKVDLSASFMALEAVRIFLGGRVVSRNLGHLHNALVEIIVGAAPAAMLQPETHDSGRRAHAPKVQEAKGMLAGIMEVQLSTGMSRQEAAQWVARHVSPEMARKISNKPLTARMIEEWRDKYGGAHGENGITRDSYLLWSGFYSPTPQRFREITEHKAKGLLARKPS
jgi:hypothetical protein